MMLPEDGSDATVMVLRRRHTIGTSSDSSGRSSCEDKNHDTFTQGSGIPPSEKCFVCSVCDKSFPSRYRMEVHKRLHSGERPYKCSDCEKAFALRQNLTAHRRIHTGEKPYVCKFCDRGFNQQNMLTSHVRIHTGEKPYVCGICEKAFAQRTGLRYHLTTHTKEKPFKCALCDKSFKIKQSLTNHIRTHAPKEALANLENRILQLALEHQQLNKAEQALDDHPQTGKHEQGLTNHSNAPSDRTFHNRTNQTCKQTLTPKRKQDYSHTDMRKQELTNQSDDTSKETSENLKTNQALESDQLTETPKRTSKDCLQVDTFEQISSKSLPEKIGSLETNDVSTLFACIECSENLPDEASLTAHMEAHNECKPYFCAHCYKSFALKIALKKHCCGTASERMSIVPKDCERNPVLVPQRYSL